MSRVYLDHPATTPLDPRVLAAMKPYLTDRFGNPHADTHPSGLEAQRAVEAARLQIASAVKAPARDIVFTSGATEANNLAVLGTAAASHKRRTVVVQATEHSSVLEPAASLSRLGYEVVTIGVRRDGIVDVDALANAITGDTLLTSVMLVNNETGVVQPIREIAQICRRQGALLHSDCAQALGRVPLDVKALGVDLASLSAHKAYGPQGVGAIYVRRRRSARIKPLTFGGGQEGGLRPGTLPVPLCVGFGEAASLAVREQPERAEAAARLESRLWAGIQESGAATRLNGHPARRAPGCMSIEFIGCRADALIDAWHGLEVAQGSACSASRTKTSHVLRAMKLTKAQADATVRMGVGRFTTEEDIDRATSIIQGSFRREPKPPMSLPCTSPLAQ